MIRNYFSTLAFLLVLTFTPACLDEDIPPETVKIANNTTDNPEDNSGNDTNDDSDNNTDASGTDDGTDTGNTDDGTGNGGTDDGTGNGGTDDGTGTGGTDDGTGTGGTDDGTGNGGTDDGMGTGGTDDGTGTGGTDDGMDNGGTDDGTDTGGTDDGMDNGGTRPTGVWQESDRIVVMEAENTLSNLGSWREQSRFSGYSGSGYLRFNGNTPVDGEPNSPLEYEFKIQNGGNYRLDIHTSRDPGSTEIENNHSNDIYIRMEGDYSDVPTKEDYAPLAMLQEDNKFFTRFQANSDGSTSTRVWDFATLLDPVVNENFKTCWYRFKAGETYKLVISGRSQYYIIDRIVLAGGYTEAERQSITTESVRE